MDQRFGPRSDEAPRKVTRRKRIEELWPAECGRFAASWLSLWRRAIVPLLAVLDADSVRKLKPPGPIGVAVQTIFLDLMGTPEAEDPSPQLIEHLLRIRQTLPESDENAEDFFFLVDKALKGLHGHQLAKRVDAQVKSPGTASPSLDRWRSVPAIAMSCGIKGVREIKAFRNALSRLSGEFPEIRGYAPESICRTARLQYDTEHKLVRETMDHYGDKAKRHSS